MSLPIEACVTELLTELKKSNQVILQAPPGAGKSTYLPLVLIDAIGEGKIVMLEPRRLAAKSIALRLSEQRGELVGERIGYRIKSEQRVSRMTRVEVVTEGVFLRMLQQDPLLEGVAMVIFDEFHERSVQSDLALALTLDSQKALREDLRILLMSATLDNANLQQFLPNAAFVCSQGRSFPVERHFLPLDGQRQFTRSVTQLILRLLQEESGSMLVFLSGVAEINAIARELSLAMGRDDSVLLYPLYGALPLSEQRKAVLPCEQGKRKVVLATNIAETSVTIDGITLVVDSGYEKKAIFDVRTGLTRLVRQRISQASQIQRAGRAGRLAPGQCWHLMSQEQAQRARQQIEPEILSSDLTSLLMELKAWGCHESSELDWLTPPPQPNLMQAQRLLHTLAILDDEGNLTALGRQVATLPCEPRLGALLVNAKAQGADTLNCAAKLCAVIEEPPRSGSVDVLDWLAVRQPLWERRANQLCHQLATTDTRVTDKGDILSLLVAAFPDRVARQRGKTGDYLLACSAGATLGELTDNSRIRLSDEPWLVVIDLLLPQGQSQAQIRLAVAINETVLHNCRSLQHIEQRLEWTDSGSLQAIKETKLGALVLYSEKLSQPSQAQLIEALLNWLKSAGLSELPWDERSQQLRERVACAKQWLPEEAWPELSDEALLASLTHWLTPYLSHVKQRSDLARVPLYEALLTRFDWQSKKRLDEALPEYYHAPTGTRVAIHYQREQAPVIHIRLQEMLGEKTNPTVAQGRVPVLLDLLSPAHRSLQITGDLAGFWAGSYQEVKKEMKGRYPKHLWPDSPENTRPTKRIKRLSGHE